MSGSESHPRRLLLAIFSRLSIKSQLIAGASGLVLLTTVLSTLTAQWLATRSQATIKAGVTENLEAISTNIATRLRDLAESARSGIDSASDLRTVEKVTGIARDSLRSLGARAVTTIENGVNEALPKQTALLETSLDGFLGATTESMSEIMEFDAQSQQVLGALAVFNLDSVTATSVDSLARFGLLMSELDRNLTKVAAANEEAIDGVLIGLVEKADDDQVSKEDVVDFIMVSFEDLKSGLRERNQSLSDTTRAEFALQSKVMAEDLRLTNRKVNFAVNDELRNASTGQSERIDEIITALLERQTSTMEAVERSIANLGKTLRNDVPAAVRGEAEAAEKQLAEEGKTAQEATEALIAEVGGNMEKSREAAVAGARSSVDSAVGQLGDQLEETASRGLRANLLVAAICVGFGVVLAYIFAIMLMRPIQRTLEILRDIAEGEGDLTRRIEVTAENEIGQMARWFNVFVDKLQGVIRQVSGNTTSLTSSAHQLSTTSEKMSSNAREMSDSVDSVASTMRDLSASFHEVARSCDDSSRIATEANEKATGVGSAMDELVGSARQIDRVVDLIQSIATQTNLLALNATIEAARAGDAGKGFAVVASEVKALAEQSGTAAEQIARQVATMQGNTSSALGLIGEIREVIENLAQISGTIAAAVEEQSVTTTQVTSTVERTNESTEQTVSGARETDDNARELNSMAKELAEVVGQFKI